MKLGVRLVIFTHAAREPAHDKGCVPVPRAVLLVGIISDYVICWSSTPCV